MRPKIVGLGGTLRPTSSGSAALKFCLEVVRANECDGQLLTGIDLDLPMYHANAENDTPRVRALLDAMRGADGILIASPGYHGSVSGLVKNVLDYTEAMRDDERCYLANVPVGCIVSAAGWQAGGSTLASLRAIVHALRGWPTPLGVIFNSTNAPFDAQGTCMDQSVAGQLTEMTRQVIFAARRFNAPKVGECPALA